MTTTKDQVAGSASRAPNGPAMAAVLAAGIGSAVLGLVVLIGAAGLFSFPSIYAPVGGLSTRSTIAVIAWVVAWGVLNKKWAGRDVAAGRVLTWTLALVAFAVVATFPPVWELF